jgi:Ribonuclease G/E
VFRAILHDVRKRCDDRAHPVTAGGESEYLIRASEQVVDRLLDEDADQLADLSQRISLEIRIQVEPSYGPGQFDVVVVRGSRR